MDLKTKEYFSDLAKSKCNGDLITVTKSEEYVNGELVSIYYRIGPPDASYRIGEVATIDTKLKVRYLGEENDETPGNSSAGERIMVWVTDADKSIFHYERFFWAEILN